MFDRTHDARVRAAAFEWLSDQVKRYSDVLPRQVLAAGFELDGMRVPLLGPQGIFKPKVLSEVPLTITTAPEGPYDDAFGSDGLLRYRYRGSNPDHPDNRGLRAAMEHRLPLIYLHGVVPGRYVAAWPVFVVRDDPAALSFSVEVDDATYFKRAEEISAGAAVNEGDDARRRYITASVRVRLHQRAFRERVLDAYRWQCAFCRLRHEELLDAAHIAPDSTPEGEPLVRNGLALCALHHTAFDRLFVGLRPDYIIEVRADIRKERDGPTLVHAIQALHGTRIVLPRSVPLRPDPTLVAARYADFQATTR
jgi:putative restriction endonuclease